MQHIFLPSRGGLAAVLFLLLTALAGQAQTPAWQKATAVGGAGTVVRATATNASGDVYLAGEFEGSISLDNTTLTSAGDKDIFVAKWSPVSGRFVWAQRAGGAGSDQAFRLAVSGTSVYLAGNYLGPASFGSTSLSAPAPGDVDGFVAKLTDAGTSGSFVWAQRAGDDAHALAVTGSSVYVGGSFTSTASFGSTALTSAGYTDAYVAKLVDNGAESTFAWAIRAGGIDYEQATALAVTSAGAVYVAGYFVDTAEFGGTSLTSAGSYDAFVAKLTDAGATASFAWVQRAGGVGPDLPHALALNGPSVYVAGEFTRTADFGALSLTDAGAGDVFVAKLTDAGASASFTWAQRAGGLGSDAARALVAVGPSIYLAGSIGGDADFGSATLPTTGSLDVFAALLTDAGASGSFRWAQHAGSTSDDQALALAVSSSTVYVTGQCTPPATFDSQVVTSSGAGPVGFLASFNTPTLATATATLPATLTLYPNPAHATTTVQLPPVAGAATATLTLLDAVGRLVRTQAVALPATGLRTELNLGGLPAGLYALRVAVGGSSAMQRLVVE